MTDPLGWDGAPSKSLTFGEEGCAQHASILIQTRCTDFAYLERKHPIHKLSRSQSLLEEETRALSRNHSRVLTQPPVPPGRLDIGVEHVSDCERLAKQCQLWDLLEDLEAKCEKVSEFGVYRVSVQGLGL